LSSNVAVNLALNQPAIAQSSWYIEVAALAVDGNVTSEWCTATPYDSFPWLQIDLGALVHVDTVTVTNPARELN